jgi:hypothetical protein
LREKKREEKRKRREGEREWNKEWMKCFWPSLHTSNTRWWLTEKAIYFDSL